VCSSDLTFDATNGIRTVRQVDILYSGGSAVDSNITVTLIKQFAWGDEVVQETAGYGTAEAQTTTYDYWTDTDNNYGQLKIIENPDGSWTRYDAYDVMGREKIVCSTFKNSLPSALASACRVTEYYYPGDPELVAMNFPADDVASPNDSRPRLVVEKVLGIEVSRTYTAYLADRTVNKRCISAGAAYNADNNLTTVTYIHANGSWQGRPWKIENPDGTVSLYSYSLSAGNLITTNKTGVWNGSDVVDGIMTVAIQNPDNRTLSSITRDILSGITISDMHYTRDACGRETCVSNTVDHSFSTSAYGPAGLLSSIDNDGIGMTYLYDENRRLVTTTRLGISSSNRVDASGNVVQQTRWAGSETITTSAGYDKAGRIVTSINEMGYVTTYAYSSNASGEQIVTTTYPPALSGVEGDGATYIETTYRDGKNKSLSGTGVYPAFYDYGVDADGAYTVEYKGADSTATEWVKTYTDLLGRTAKVVYPNGTNSFFYNLQGQLIRQSEFGIRQSVTDYNSKGEAFRSAVDMNGDGQIDPGGIDRISESESSYTTFNGKDVRQTISKTYPTNGSSAFLVLSMSLSSLDGTKSWAISFGRTNMSEVSRNRANAARTETVTRSDGTQSISSYTNNILWSVTEKRSDGVTESTRSMVYDVWNRLQTTVEPAANGETRTTVYRYNVAGIVTNVTVSAGALSQVTTYVLDSMGRRIKTILPDGGVVNYSYNTQGALISQSGVRTYPVTYSYTGQGRLAAMSTYRNGLSGSADVTFWQYDPQRGWMTFKVYADGSSNSYSYLPDGKLQKRTWARGIETTYAYDNAGSLTNISYSDSTPGISYTLDRFGSAVEIRDAIGAHTNIFAEDGSLLSESLPQISDGVLRFTRDTNGRLTNSSLFIGGTRAVASAYGFDTAGRISSVSDGAHTATYTYGLDGSTWTNLSFGAALNTRRSFDGLNRLSSISNLVNFMPFVVNSYSLNQANQRTRCDLADGSYWIYQYDNLGQVVSGKKYFSDGQPVQGAQFEYNYDTIGNRTSGGRAGPPDPPSYTANNLNQYSQRTVPGKVFVAGTAATNAVVMVRRDTNSVAQAAERHGEYFWKEIAVPNSDSVYYSTNIEIRAVMTQGSNSLVRLEKTKAIVLKTPEVFTWDADGNLLSDGLWTNIWNGENRLIAMQSVGTSGPLVRLEFAYDYMGRRTSKSVYILQSAVWNLQSQTTFVYDGWNLISEITVSPSLPVAVSTNFFTWGLDLSGSLQGAGGVGGLISATLGGSGTPCTVYYVYNGNGDVMGLVYADNGSVSTSGTIVAEYEYSPFGETLKSTGSLAKANPFRFSTKYEDHESHWQNFGYRLYISSLGRFASVDPIGEAAGENAYIFVFNNPISDFDYLGNESWLKKVAHGVGMVADVVTGPPRRIGGELTSVVTLERFQKEGVSPVNPEQRGQSKFLLTFAGMANTRTDNERFGEELMIAFPRLKSFLGSYYWGYVNNPAPPVIGIVFSIAKLPADEMGAPRYPIRTALRYLKQAYQTGRKNNSCDINILVAAHSQGSEILANALSYVSTDIKKTMRILTLNAEHPIPDTGEYAWVRNFAQQGLDIGHTGGSFAPDAWFSTASVQKIPGLQGHARIGFKPYLSGIAEGFVPEETR
ncbi:MAG: hypothetical protein PHR77_09345, partial [Kiritimatiellae bacterium]|nr:hypothetical protein [Kiritimatiellia bacterium]